MHRTPGGSSGGSAVAVAAGLAGAAIGSDGAGSIRIPAACCGLFGLKAQSGRVPTAPAVEPFAGLTTLGPLTRGVADSALVYDAIKDGGPSFAEAAGREPGRLRIAVSVETPPLTGVQADAEQLSGVQALTRLLRDLGHEVDRARDRLHSADRRQRDRALPGRDRRGGRGDLGHPERFSRRTRGYIRMGSAIPEAFVERAKTAAAADGAALDRVFEGGVDAVITPMFTRRPPRVRRVRGPLRVVGVHRLDAASCRTAAGSTTPASRRRRCPAAWTADGFPVGAQLVVPPHGEPVLLSLAAQLERELGWLERRPEAVR